MNYHRIYEQLIFRAQNRNLNGYVEKHHILPRCLGGSNVKSNLVRLTAKEHRFAHLLLHRMHPGHTGLQFAAFMLTRAAGRDIGWIREGRAERQQGIKLSPRTAEHTAKQSAGQQGKKRGPHKPETILKMQANRKAVADEGKGTHNKPHTSETKAKMSLSAFERERNKRIMKSYLIDF